MPTKLFVLVSLPPRATLETNKRTLFGPSLRIAVGGFP
jgi:hypothetical protein